MIQQSRAQQATQHPAPAPPTLPEVMQPLAPVRVVAGADVQDMPLVGRTVGEARTVAQAVFGIAADAAVLIDGKAVAEDAVLGAGQLLEFVKHAGQKGAIALRRKEGAAAARGQVIELTDRVVTWRRCGQPLATTTVGQLLRHVAAMGHAPQHWQLYPRQVRLMVERRGGCVTGVVIEMPPGPRQVRWIADDSRDPYGPGSRYDDRYLSFPWVVLLVVFADGELSSLQQAFYRNAPLGSPDDELYFTNLLNVARGYEQESWVCLANLRRRLGGLSWEDRIRAVTDHVWHGAFNRSAEIHEGNSFWETSREIDPRLASAAAWEAATRANPYFALEVPWRRAPHTLRQTLAAMLEMIAPWRPIERVEQLITLMQQSAEYDG